MSRFLILSLLCLLLSSLSLSQLTDKQPMEELFNSQLGNAFAIAFDKLSEDKQHELILQVGILGVFFREHKKTVRHEGIGYEFGYPEMGIEFEETIAQKCVKTDSNGLKACIDYLFELVVRRNKWLYSNEEESYETDLTDVLLPSILVSDSLSQSLTISQILCFFSMSPVSLMAKIPFCRFTNNHFTDWVGEKKNMKWKSKRNLDDFFHTFDEFEGDDYECAKKSFCPNSCAETSDDGQPLFTCPSLGKCSLPSELNDYLPAMRRNEWNESCPCHAHQRYRSDIGVCASVNVCEEMNCKDREICIPTSSGGRCICQIGFYRIPHTRECEKVESAGGEWKGLAYTDGTQGYRTTITLIFSVFCFL